MDHEAKALEIINQIDAWIVENRRTGKFPGDGHEGDEYLCGLIAAALREEQARVIDECALVADDCNCGYSSLIEDGDRTRYVRGSYEMARQIAECIRALKDGT